MGLLNTSRVVDLHLLDDLLLHGVLAPRVADAVAVLHHEAVAILEGPDAGSLAAADVPSAIRLGVCLRNEDIAFRGALQKIGRFQNVPTVGTNLENRTFVVP